MNIYALLPISLSLIVYILLGLIILLKTLRGHRKGYKADLYWLITNILFWVSFVVLSSIFLGKKLVESPKLVEIVNLVGVDTGDSANLVEYGTDFLSVKFNLDLAQDGIEQLMDVVYAILQVVLKIIVLIPYAIVYHFLVALIYLIFFKRHFKPKKIKIEKYKKTLARKHIDEKKQEELIAKAEKRNKKSKRAKRFGWITGFVRGTISAVVFLSIFNSFVNILPTLHSLTENEYSASEGDPTPANTKQMNIYDFICDKFPDLKEVCEYINEYKEGKLAHITDLKIGEKTLDAFLVDILLEGKSGDVTFSIREEVSSIIQIAEYACALTNGFDLNSVDFLALNDYQVECAINIINLIASDSLVKNLGEAAITIALSIDSIEAKLPSGFEMPEIDLDIEQELKSIANMVGDAYDLLESSGIASGKFNFNALDPDKVESLVDKIADLQTVQIICSIGSSIAVDSLFVEKDENGNITNQDKLDSIKNKLADVVWKDDISDLGTLYRSYLNLGIAEMQEDPTYQNEDGKLNIVKAITSISNDKFNSIIETIFETDFMIAVLPDVMDIVRTKYIPEEYRSLISPNITTTASWENELKALLSIIKDLTNDGRDPIEAIDKFNYSAFKNISTKTIVDSELLTYAMIGILIDASNGEGLAGSVVGDFITVPSELKAEADATTHKFNTKWYSTETTQGELEVMLNALKNIAGSVSSLDNILGSITDILDAINPNDFSKSSVLHYTVSNLLIKYASDFIVIPTDSFMAKTDMAEADRDLDIIKASEIENIIDILTDENVFNIKTLMVYTKTLEDGSESKLNNDEYQALTEEEKEGYTSSFNSSLDIDSIMGILTSKNLYDPDSTEPLDVKDANLNKLFGSNIFRATISYYIDTYAGDFISMPSTEGSYEMVDVYVAGKAATETEPAVEASTKQVKVLSLKESKNLVKTIDILDLDITSISEDPFTIVNSFKTSEGNYKATTTQKIFANQIDSNENPDYSETFHATLSKFVIDFANDGGSSSDFAIKIPDEAKNNDYLAYEEIDSFLEGMCYIDINNLVNSTSNIGIVSLVHDNHETIHHAFGSKIIRYSISNFLANGEATKDFITLPEAGDSIEVLHIDGENANVLTSDELTKIFNGFDALIVSQAEVNEVEPSELPDDSLMNPSVTAIKEASDEMFESTVICILVSSKVDSMGGSMGLVIPKDVYDYTNKMIQGTELTNIVNGLCEITEGGSITNLSIDKDDLINKLSGMSDEKINGIFSSEILRASMTNAVLGVEALKIPHDVNVIEENELDKDDELIDILKTDEICRLVKLFNAIGGENKSLENLDVSTLSIDSLITMMNTLSNGDHTGSSVSGIFRATLSDKLLELNSNASIYIGIEGNFTNAAGESLVEYDSTEYPTANKYNYTNIDYIKYSEIEKMFASMKVLLGSQASTGLSSLSGDSFTSNTSSMLHLSDENIDILFESDIMVSTMSYIISGLFGGASSTLVYLSDENEPYQFTRYDLPREELSAFYRAIQVVIPSDSTDDINNINLDFEGIVGNLDTTKVSTLTSSLLLSYNIKNYLITLNSSGFGDMLALDDIVDCENHASVCAHNYNRYYYSYKIVGDNMFVPTTNDLAGLLTSFAGIYGNEEYVKAFKDTANANASILTTKGFIDLICGEGSSNVIIDSLPNMINQFKSRITSMLGGLTITGDFYVPDRFYETSKFATFEDWQAYWYGDFDDETEGYKQGQLYKFFNILNVDTSNPVTAITNLITALNACELTASLLG